MRSSLLTPRRNTDLIYAINQSVEQLYELAAGQANLVTLTQKQYLRCS